MTTFRPLAIRTGQEKPATTVFGQTGKQAPNWYLQHHREISPDGGDLTGITEMPVRVSSIPAAGCYTSRPVLRHDVAAP